ncbi:MAG: hypothetical protein BAJALOKI3v1_170032 [Promethearchaeota archaeon]|jgi:internalin A|nr:MAG: hypothetical protein BAJALOKI3v1_170032 [Candidatus Lokiarchaeota archaeon]
MVQVTVRDQVFEVIDNKLSLRNQNISDISEINGLENLSNLKKLDLSGNNITEIKNLGHLKNLEMLNLANNNIAEIKNLDDLRNLKVLILSHNKIAQARGLNNLNNLEMINLNNNWIDAVREVFNLTNLKRIYLEDNEVTDIRELENLNNLQYIALSPMANIPKSQLKKLKKKGIDIEIISQSDNKEYQGPSHQTYLEEPSKPKASKSRKNLIIFGVIGYFVFFGLLSAAITYAIVQNFSLPSTDFFPIFGSIYLGLIIFGPCLFAMAMSYQ